MAAADRPRGRRFRFAAAALGLGAALALAWPLWGSWFGLRPPPRPAPSPAKTAPVTGKVAYYTCAMHPSVRKSAPGSCPICGMTLTPVTRAEEQEGIVTVPAVRRQELGIRTGRVTRAPLLVPIRALGHITYDETQLDDVSPKIDGWIRKLYVNETGQAVKKGQLLFTLYSPALFAAEKEYQIALGGRSRSPELVAAARQRLHLWDLSPAQLARVAAAKAPLEALPFYAPSSGYVVEKNVVAGAAVKAGDRLFRIAALGRVWVEAQLYESDLPLVKVGDRATITLDYLPGRVYHGRVSFLYPYLDSASRTGTLRIALANDSRLALRPGMYAQVALQVNLGERLQVPESAVLYTGPRRLVFVDLGQGRLRPVPVRLGQRAGDAYEVLSGLSEGDVVVTSGNFLIAAESRIRSAAKFWEPIHGER